jgi:hypothetical protein
MIGWQCSISFCDNKLERIESMPQSMPIMSRLMGNGPRSGAVRRCCRTRVGFGIGVWRWELRQPADGDFGQTLVDGLWGSQVTRVLLPVHGAVSQDGCPLLTVSAADSSGAAV